MPNQSGSRSRPRRDPRLVAALVYDNLCTFEFGITAEIFGLRRPEMGKEWYRFVTCSETRELVRAGGGVMVQAQAGLSVLARAGTIVIPGWRSEGAAASPRLVRALRAAHANGARLVTICSGAFLLAELGLLAGRTATTHWRYADGLRNRFPDIMVDPDVLYVDGGDILTSAGSAAGIDLLLHVVRKDFGPDAANVVARRLVAPPHRDGGQQQFIPSPVPRAREGRLSMLMDQVVRHPARDWSLPSMATYARMSQRTFCRRFQDLSGMPPGEWLIRSRLDKARQLLEGTPAALPEIASACGFGSPENFTRRFRQRVGLSPARYRKTFAARGPGAAAGQAGSLA